MAQAKAKLTEVVVSETSKISRIDNLVGIRVSPNNYFATFFLANFITGFLVYLEKDLAAFFLFLFSWGTIPVLAWKDRIVFDGKYIFRTGLLPKFWAKINRRSRRLRISQIEQIETQALRALRRGGSVLSLSNFGQRSRLNLRVCLRRQRLPANDRSALQIGFG